jgi:hypothetical protein
MDWMGATPTLCHARLRDAIRIVQLFRLFRGHAPLLWAPSIRFPHQSACLYDWCGCREEEHQGEGDSVTKMHEDLSGGWTAYAVLGWQFHVLMLLQCTMCCLGQNLMMATCYRSTASHLWTCSHSSSLGCARAPHSQPPSSSLTHGSRLQHAHCSFPSFPSADAVNIMMHTQHREGAVPGPPRCGRAAHDPADISYRGAGGSVRGHDIIAEAAVLLPPAKHNKQRQTLLKATTGARMELD